MAQEKPDGGYSLEELQGLPLTAIVLRGIIKLIFGEDQETILHIERDFTVWTPLSPQGAKVDFRPHLADWTPSGMQELAQLFRSVVKQADAGADATLTISFTNGNRLQIDPDPGYEAWGLWFPDGGWLGQPAGAGFVAPDSN